MKIISFCLFFNPGATTLIVYIESNRTRTQEILSSGPGTGKFNKQVCSSVASDVCSNCATRNMPSKFLLYFEYQPK